MKTNRGIIIFVLLLFCFSGFSIISGFSEEDWYLVPIEHEVKSCEWKIDDFGDSYRLVSVGSKYELWIEISNSKDNDISGLITLYKNGKWYTKETFEGESDMIETLDRMIRCCCFMG